MFSDEMTGGGWDMPGSDPTPEREWSPPAWTPPQTPSSPMSRDTDNDDDATGMGSESVTRRPSAARKGGAKKAPMKKAAKKTASKKKAAKRVTKKSARKAKKRK